jgi:hypothetical protein
MITCELHNSKNYDPINERISKLGDCIRPLSSFWLINTTLSYNELYNHVNSVVGRDDMFYITSISSAGIGRLDIEDTNWIKKKFLIPVTPLTPTGTTRGPLPVKEPAYASNSPPYSQRSSGPGQKPAVPVQRPASPRKPASSVPRQRYPERNWDY